MKHRSKIKFINLDTVSSGVLGLTLSLLLTQGAQAKGTSASEVKEQSRPAESKDAPPPEADMEQVNVEGIKERYWARGNEAELGVVQNRTYSKTHKLELGLLGGVAFSDPFLTVKYYGLDFGYHLSEFVSLHLLFMRYGVGSSNALLEFERAQGATTNTNIPSYYLGSELDASILYGKLSVLGKSIIYYDLHLLGGVGATKTETGNYVTPSLGIGQRFYLSKITSLRIDYRLQYYSENIVEKQILSKLGQMMGARDNFNNTITFGLSFMLFGN